MDGASPPQPPVEPQPDDSFAPADATIAFDPAPAPAPQPAPEAPPAAQPPPAPAPQPALEPQPVMAPHQPGPVPRPEPNLVAEARNAGLEALESLTPSLTPDTPAQITARVGAGIVPAAESQRRWAHLQAFNWRLALVRLLCAGLAVVTTVVIVPGLDFTRWQRGTFLLVAVVFGLLNAIVKPVLQFLVLRFIFSTYGFVVVLINTLLLWALDRLTDGLIEIGGAIAALLGGLGVGVFGLLFETLLGANPPIVDSRATPPPVVQEVTL